jgi:hypothetical protein
LPATGDASPRCCSSHFTRSGWALPTTSARLAPLQGHGVPRSEQGCGRRHGAGRLPPPVPTPTPATASPAPHLSMRMSFPESPHATVDPSGKPYRWRT